MVSWSREVGVAIDVDSWLRALQNEALQANRAGVSDTRLAYSVIAVGAGQPVAEDARPHRELVQRIAWAVFVRAPALDLRWLVKGALDLDKVYWGDLELASLLGRVRSLEQDRPPDPSPSASRDRQPAVKKIQQVAGRLEQIAHFQGERLREAVSRDIFEVKQSAQDGDLLDMVIDNRKRAGREP